MSLLHPSRRGSRVAVWFLSGDPVRVVHNGQRFRVVGSPTPMTASGGRRAWELSVRDERGFGTRLRVRELAGGDWELDGVA